MNLTEKHNGPLGFIKLYEYTPNEEYSKPLDRLYHGTIHREIDTKNLLTFLGAGLLAQGEEISHMYLEHADPGASGYIENSLNGLSADRGDDISVMRTAPRDTVDAEVQILSTTDSNSSPSDYPLANVRTYIANFNDVNLDGRIIVGAGLIKILDNGQEILGSHAYFPATIKVASREIILLWSRQFL